jgi:H+/Cl- antiporter ClcA
MNPILTILSILYGATGVVVTIGYFPTIRDLLKKRKSANILSYVIWVICGFIVLLYSLFVLPDTLFIGVSALNFLCCALILILALGLRKKKNA